MNKQRKSQKKIIITIAVVIAAVTLLGAGVYAATVYGTESDPLITLSYLTDSVQPDLLNEVEDDIDTKVSALESSFNKAIANAGTVSVDTYSVITLSSGQTLTGETGCEIIIREGSANVTGELINSTNGTTPASGTNVTANHLHMVSGERGGVEATSSVTLLVRGTFSIS